MEAAAEGPDGGDAVFEVPQSREVVRLGDGVAVGAAAAIIVELVEGSTHPEGRAAP